MSPTIAVPPPVQVPVAHENLALRDLQTQQNSDDNTTNQTMYERVFFFQKIFLTVSIFNMGLTGCN